jgi:uncharacterized protein DUF5753
MTYPGVSAETVAARLASRMARQARLFERDVLVWFVVDALSLCRLVGSTATMAGQMRRLGEVAALPNVTIQILPAVAHPVRFQNSATSPGLGFYAARSYSLMRPPRMGQRWIRFWERSATGWSGRGGWSWRLRWGRRPL